MILETAVLSVEENLQPQFEKDFHQAGQYISSIKGYKGHTLKKCLENKKEYLLLVNWETVENHTIGFRTSKAYLKWKALLHHYYKPFPTVKYYKTIIKNNLLE